MDIKETIITALTALRSNPLRTALAILGIVIGIASVVSLISLGQSAQASVTDRIASIGSNLLTISPSSSSQGTVRGATGSANTLTLTDAEAIAANASLTTVATVSAEVSRNYQITAGRNNMNARVSGVMADHTKTANISMSEGSFITNQNISGLDKVAVLGPNITTELFGTGSALGQTIKINDLSFIVIGVTETKGGNGFGSTDDSIFVPITTAQKLLVGSNYVNSIYVTATDSNTMDQTMDEVGWFLLRRHGLNNIESADFSIRSQADLLETVTETTGTFTNLLAGIAAISLLVGGIGIMNIMLVTITERTREIGIRKSLGAKRKDILLQFLIESIALTLVGGLVGILLGIGISIIGSRVLNLPSAVSVYAPILAFSVSSLIGIVFGYYPARRAAKLPPIVALRYE